MKCSLFDGAKELLAALQGKVKVALASMNNRTVIGHLLKVKDLEDCFEVVMTGEAFHIQSLTQRFS